MKNRLLSTIMIVTPLLVLLFGFGGNITLLMRLMPDMGKQMSQNQCQSSCSSQSNTVADSQETTIDEKDIEPQPAEPYYLAFMGAGWSLVLLLSVYLLRHLHWRPPDIYKLNSVYRF